MGARSISDSMLGNFLYLNRSSRIWHMTNTIIGFQSFELITRFFYHLYEFLSWENLILVLAPNLPSLGLHCLQYVLRDCKGYPSQHSFVEDDHALVVSLIAGCQLTPKSISEVLVSSANFCTVRLIVQLKLFEGSQDLLTDVVWFAIFISQRSHKVRETYTWIQIDNFSCSFKQFTLKVKGFDDFFTGSLCCVRVNGFVLQPGITLT